MKNAVVLGAGGFIGGHLCEKLKNRGYYVIGVDIKNHEYRVNNSFCDKFIVGDLREKNIVESVIDKSIDEVYQLAADMGGAEFVFTGENDANIMHNSAMINLHVCDICVRNKIKKVFYSSSACMYPEYNQLDPNNPKCDEASAYPAAPDSEYGWEKLFSERLFLAYSRNHNLNVRIARFHNIFGPLGTWRGGREKAPAAICRKVCETDNDGTIEIFGDGKQTRSFLYVDECVEGILKLMESEFTGPVNIGSDEMVTINQLVDIVANIANKKVNKKHISGPIGVQGRNSDNTLIYNKLGWKPSAKLKDGLEKTYQWIQSEMQLSE
jgi:GDP-D-mannose 3', 5'-epimerase